MQHIKKKLSTDGGKYWDPMGPILPSIRIPIILKCMLITRLDLLNKSRRDMVVDSVDNSIEIVLAEEELARRTTKQSIHCLGREDEVGAGWYEQNRGRGESDKSHILGLYSVSPSGWVYTRLGKHV